MNSRVVYTLLLSLVFFCHPALAIDDYEPGPDAQFNPDVPRGVVTKHRWEESKVFPGTVHDYWVYVPKQYDATKPAAVMVFQDGGTYVSTNGSYRVPIVFDNLIARGELPIIVGIFISPGVIPSPEKGKEPTKNRSVEYDTVSDVYARFLLEEILPAVSQQVNLTTNREGRALCGQSSGGICAFTAAWHRPEEFSKVFSIVGSFVNIRGGHVYPSLIRKTERKPIRVFLQDGSNDLDNAHGNWYLANLEMEAALKFAKYDYKTVFGDGGHSGKHGGAIFPDEVKWLWRDYPKN